MGVCESKANLPSHVSQHSIEQEAYSESGKSETKLRAANHNDLIDKAKEVIDAANAKIKTLQDRVNNAQSTNESLKQELHTLEISRIETDKLTNQYKEELQVQQETMIRWRAKIKSLQNELIQAEAERAENDKEYRNNLITIADTLHKVHGDQISKLRFNKMSKKFVVFINKINHLFYYDENGPKYLKIKHISVNNSAIQKHMNQGWFLVIGERRNALFVAETKLIRDKWVEFIRNSLELAKPAVQTVALAAPKRNEMEEEEKLEAEEIHKHSHDDKHGGHSHCFGQCQSPINIVSIDSADNNDKTIELQGDQFAENGLKFNYPEKVRECTIMNNGHTVQVNIPDNAKCRLQIYNKEYALKQFHFHTPSEHTLDSKQYEMEMHLVHVNEVGEICVLGFIFTCGQRYQKPRLKLTKSRAHLVLAHGKKKRRQMDEREQEERDEESDDLETDDEWEDDDEEEALKQAKKGNDFLRQFWDQLPTMKTERDIPLKKPISFDYLFETASKNVKKNVKSNEIEIDMDIFEYMGSLTTPPYTEGVQWLVSKTTHFINEEQLKALRICWNNHNNARPVQKYFGRQVSLRSKSSLRVPVM